MGDLRIGERSVFAHEGFRCRGRVATIGGMLVAVLGAFADEYWKQSDETRICTANPGSGGELRLYTYPPASSGADYKMQGADSPGRPSASTGVKPGGWDGPLGGGNGSTSILSRQARPGAPA